MATAYIGIDLHRTVIQICVLDASGERIAEERIRYGGLQAGLDVLVCDPRKLDLKKLGKKTDRRDAREIARRLWLGDLDRMARTYYPTDVEYGRRKLLRVRHRLVQMRQQTVNQLRGLLNAYQVSGHRTKKLGLGGIGRRSWVLGA